MSLRKSVFRIVSLVCLVSLPVVAQSPTQFVEYSAKFLCGTVAQEGPAVPGMLAPGV